MRGRGLLLVAALLVAGCKAATIPADNKTEAPPAVTVLDMDGRVTDAAHVLKAEEIKSLTGFLSDFEAQTKHQMVVVTVPSLNGRSIERYTLDLANRWGIGRKGFNDGIVLLMAPSERRVRIEIGKGLEHTLSNDFCANVINHMIPAFKDRRYFEGLMTGVKSLAKAARRA